MKGPNKISLNLLSACNLKISVLRSNFQWAHADRRFILFNTMDFKDSIKQLSERVFKLKENILTEEATKNAFIMPFINALGYDVFNPLEVVPEMTCDIAMKKGEK